LDGISFSVGFSVATMYDVYGQLNFLQNSGFEFWWLLLWELPRTSSLKAAGTLQPWKEKALGDSYQCVTWREGVEMMEPDSSEWYPVTGQDILGKNWNTRNSI